MQIDKLTEGYVISNKIRDNLEIMGEGLFPPLNILKKLNKYILKHKYEEADRIIVSIKKNGLIFKYVREFFKLLYSINDREFFSIIEDKDVGYTEIIPLYDSIREIGIEELLLESDSQLFSLYCKYIEQIDNISKNYILSRCRIL